MTFWTILWETARWAGLVWLMWIWGKTIQDSVRDSRGERLSVRLKQLAIETGAVPVVLAFVTLVVFAFVKR